MENQIEEYITSQIAETESVLGEMLSSPKLLKEIGGAAVACSTSYLSGGKILLAGNGGSAADAQHIAAEFVNIFAFERPGLSAIALTVDSSVVTAISNDSSYEQVFARQIQAHGKKGDVFFGYSTSGKSPNVIAALIEAKSRGITTVGFTGNKGGPMNEYCDFLFDIPSSSTPKIQEGHLVIGHIISGIVESTVFKQG